MFNFYGLLLVNIGKLHMPLSIFSVYCVAVVTVVFLRRNRVACHCLECLVSVDFGVRSLVALTPWKASPWRGQIFKVYMMPFFHSENT